MDFNQFCSHVDALKARKPIWFGLESEPLASESDISTAEAALGVRLPNSYRDFVRTYGGGFFAFGNVFSVAVGSDWNIVEKNRQTKIPAFLVVSDNGAGDYYGFSVVDQVCGERIYLWDHESPQKVAETSFDNLFDFLMVSALRAGEPKAR